MVYCNVLDIYIYAVAVYNVKRIQTSWQKHGINTKKQKHFTLPKNENNTQIRIYK